jgi:hypothetical protein
MLSRQRYNEQTLHDKKQRTAISTSALWQGNGSIDSYVFNKQSAFRQVSASNPPQRKAAKR